MKITYKGDYALKILLDLSLNYDKGLIQIKEISKRQDIPIKYLEQIILILKGAGYIRSKRGPVGGVHLAKSPEKIKLGEIIRLMDGTTAPITCVSKTDTSKCDYISKCPFRPKFLEIRDFINNIVDKTSFADIVDESVNLSDKVPDYSI
ncbi:MAG: Rrf2 family transcriptional regulator [Elusimicrobia bacterium]|nr:Rrf2 family transcriptional regulator [Elusimicrobiota bacterium]